MLRQLALPALSCGKQIWQITLLFVYIFPHLQPQGHPVVQQCLYNAVLLVRRLPSQSLQSRPKALSRLRTAFRNLSCKIYSRA